MFLGHYQTMKLTFEQIAQGQYPWVPLGNFMNDWYAYHIHERERLVQDSIPDEYPQEYHQWAAFCAASVVWFCSTYEVPCPSWADNLHFVLPEPWYVGAPEKMWDRLRRETWEEYSRYNIYCSVSTWNNKWEHDERGLPLRFHPLDLQERRELARRAREQWDREEAERERILREYRPIAEALREKHRKQAG